MAAVKCNKCGGIIPDGALFCPACGAPKTAEQPTPTPTQTTPPPAPAPQPVPRGGPGLIGIFDKIFSKAMLMLGISLSILLAWIGNIIATYANDSGGIKIGLVINSFGFALLGLSLIGGGIVNKTLDKNVRAGMVVGGAIMLGMSMVLSLSSVLSALTDMSRYGF